MNFSKKLQAKLKEDGIEEEVYKYISKQSFFETVVRYIIDSKYRRGVHLQQWCKQQLNNINLQEIVDNEKFAEIKNYDDRIKSILKYWRNSKYRKYKGGLVYVGDKEHYGSNEYWATVDEILATRKDDCDGFANIIYHTAIMAGIPEYRLFIVAGDVQGGGHCYVVYLADNGLFYPIDGCYWTNESYSMSKPYAINDKYYGGMNEWFRFNHTGMYKRGGI